MIFSWAIRFSFTTCSVQNATEELYRNIGHLILRCRQFDTKMGLFNPCFLFSTMGLFKPCFLFQIKSMVSRDPLSHHGRQFISRIKGNCVIEPVINSCQKFLCTYLLFVCRCVQWLFAFSLLPGRLTLSCACGRHLVTLKLYRYQ